MNIISLIIEVISGAVGGNVVEMHEHAGEFKKW